MVEQIESEPKNSWMEQALKLARLAASEDEVPVGALIIKDNQVIATGRNSRERDQDPLAHAEILAIRKAAEALGSWRLLGCTLYVTLEPCPMCLAACQQARIDKVIYGTKDPKGGALSLGWALHQDVRTNHRFEVVHEENPECGAVLSQFFKKKRNS